MLRDTTDADVLRSHVAASLKAALPESAVVEFSGDNESMVLTGRVASAELSKRAEAVASVYSKKVVNMLQVGDPRQILLEVKFADVDRTALSQLGINFFSRNPALVGASSTQQFPEPLFTSAGIPPATRKTTRSISPTC